MTKVEKSLIEKIRQRPRNEGMAKDGISFCQWLKKNQQNVTTSNRLKKQIAFLKSIFIINSLNTNSLVLATIKLELLASLAFNTTAFLEELTCPIILDFIKCSDQFWWFYWSKSDSNFLDVNPNFCMNNDNRVFCWVQKLTTWPADFTSFQATRNAEKCCSRKI